MEEDAMTDLITDRGVVLDAIRQYTHADNPSSFLAVNDGNEYFTLPEVDGVIVFRRTGRYLVQFGGPFAPPPACLPLQRAFVALAESEGRQIVAVQLQGADAPAFLELGFTVNQMGASFAKELAGFSLYGTKFMRLRNKISRALRAGLTIAEVAPDDWYEAMRELDANWLTIKGERKLEFLVGEYGGPYQHLRRLFIGTIEGKLVGYISYTPVYGSRPGWMHDLSRRLPDAMPGVMETINRVAIETFQREQVPWLHFGFTPFTELTGQPSFPGHSKAFHWFMEHLWANGEAVYPAQSQLAYKQKWAPNLVLPEYVAFQYGASIPAQVHIFRACGAV
jgi:lysylphosphatidylglycerol synthetase-like protein (DUF2156 family)